MLNGIFCVLCSGAKWRDLPGRYVSWTTVHDRFRSKRSTNLAITHKSMMHLDWQLGIQQQDLLSE